MCAANKGARGAVRFGRDAAGIDHHHIGGCGTLPQAVPGGDQMAGDGFAIRARRPAAKVLDVESRHLQSSLAFELAPDIQ